LSTLVLTAILQTLPVQPMHSIFPVQPTYGDIRCGNAAAGSRNTIVIDRG
jgi:hypothetical protein